MDIRHEAVALQLLLLAGSAYAQNTNGGTTTNGGSSDDNATTPQPGPTATTTAGNKASPTTTATTTGKTSQSSTKGSASTISVSNAPAITSATSVFSLGDVPTIAGYGIPTMVVPWTGGASFMQKSNLPEGTVFICVGALLGFMGAAILAWRGLVAWSLHRSVKRANRNLHISETAKMNKPPIYGGASTLAGASTMSLDRLAAPTSTKSRHPRSALNPLQTGSPAAARNSSLFFSPTAGAGHHSSSNPTSLLSSQNRASAFLPSGYYAAPGAAAPGSGSSIMHVGGAPTNNRKSFASHAYNASPPSSPGLPPSRGADRAPSALYNQQSSSSLNLHVPGNAHPGGRAPSANLEELFQGHSQGHPGAR